MATSNIKHAVFDDTLSMVKAGISPFLVGPAGTGKTTLAKNVAEDLELDFYTIERIDSAFQLLGFYDAHSRLVRTQFREAVEKGGLFFCDELDASDPNAITAMHSVDNGYVSFPDGRIEVHENFRLLAAGNTWGHGATLDYVGRNPLDGATLDRYAFMHVNYDPDLEAAIAKSIGGEDAMKWTTIVQHARHAAQELELRHIVSTRAIRDGLKLINAGMDMDKVFAMTVLKGLPQEDAVQLSHRVDLDITDFSAKAAATAEQKITLTQAFAALDESLTSIKELSSFVKEKRAQLASIEDACEAIEGETKTIDDIKDEITALRQRFEKQKEKMRANTSFAQNTAQEILDQQESLERRIAQLSTLSKDIETALAALGEENEALERERLEVAQKLEATKIASKNLDTEPIVEKQSDSGIKNKGSKTKKRKKGTRGRIPKTVPLSDYFETAERQKVLQDLDDKARQVILSLTADEIQLIRRNAGEFTGSMDDRLSPRDGFSNQEVFSTINGLINPKQQEVLFLSLPAVELEATKRTPKNVDPETVPLAKYFKTAARQRVLKDMDDRKRKVLLSLTADEIKLIRDNSGELPEHMRNQLRKREGCNVHDIFPTVNQCIYGESREILFQSAPALS